MKVKLYFRNAARKLTSINGQYNSIDELLRDLNKQKSFACHIAGCIRVPVMLPILAVVK